MYQVVDHRNDKSQKILYQATDRFSDQDFSSTVRKMINDVKPHEKTAGERIYADPDASRFPVDSMEDTILSKVYFDYQREKLSEYQDAGISAKLDTYLNLYDIPEQLFTYQVEKVAEAPAIEPCYLLPSMKLCKVAASSDLEKAADLFDREHKKLNVSQRVEFAINFIKSAGEYDITTYPNTIAKYAGVLDTDFESLQAMLEYRAAAASLRNLSGDQYIKLAFDLKEVDTRTTTEDRVKLAETIQKMDEAHGFTEPKYDRKMPCAYSIVFNKEAMVSSDEHDVPPTKADLVAEYGDGILDAVEDADGNIDMKKLINIRGTYAPIK